MCCSCFLCWFELAYHWLSSKFNHCGRVGCSSPVVWMSVVLPDCAVSGQGSLAFWLTRRGDLLAVCMPHRGRKKIHRSWKIDSISTLKYHEKDKNYGYCPQALHCGSSLLLKDGLNADTKFHCMLCMWPVKYPCLYLYPSINFLYFN